MKFFISFILIVLFSGCKSNSPINNKENNDSEQLFVLLQSKTIQQALIAKGALLYNLGNEEMAHEDFDGTQVLKLSSVLAKMDEDLKYLSKIRFNKGELKLKNSKYNFSTTQQFFRHYDKPDCIYLQLIDDFLRENKIEKKVFVIYDYDEAEFAICIAEMNLFEEILYSLSKLGTINTRNNPKRLNYILKQNPRVIELTAIVDSSPYRLDIIIRNEN